MAARVLSQQNVQNLLAAGAGAASAGFVDTAIPLAVDPMTKNVVVAVIGAGVATMGAGPFRMFGIGLGAVAVANIIRTFILRT